MSPKSIGRRLEALLPTIVVDEDLAFEALATLVNHLGVALGVCLAGSAR
jgi:hypothetical protein